MESTELCRIAARTKACKPEWYTPAYHRFFSEWRDRPLRVLEIGVYLGGSLQMWREYFPKATIFAIDINAAGTALSKSHDSSLFFSQLNHLACAMRNPLTPPLPKGETGGLIQNSRKH